MKSYVNVLSMSEKGRHTLYLVLDCETATLPFADEIALNSEQKKKIAIAKPLIYDIAWSIVDADLNLYTRKSYLVTETFSTPAVFNTAYYKGKRPIYTERLRNGEITLKDWNSIIKELIADLEVTDYCCAFNAMFDFKKAIPFTETYIREIYGDTYHEWEKLQRKICTSIVKGTAKSNQDFDSMNFKLRGQNYPMIDIWGVACKCLINNVTYKRKSLEHEMITDSGLYFKSSAEATHRYLCNLYDFEELHVAVDDVDIECFILHKALKKGKIPKGIIFFPFQELGTTTEFLVKAKRGVKEKHFQVALRKMQERIDKDCDCHTAFTARLENDRNRILYVYETRF